MGSRARPRSVLAQRSLAAMTYGSNSKRAMSRRAGRDAMHASTNSYGTSGMSGSYNRTGTRRGGRNRMSRLPQIAASTPSDDYAHSSDAATRARLQNSATLRGGTAHGASAGASFARIFGGDAKVSPGGDHGRGSPSRGRHRDLPSMAPRQGQRYANSALRAGAKALGLNGSSTEGGFATGQRSGGRGVTLERTAASGACSIAGLKPGNPNWKNQDNYIAIDTFGSGKKKNADKSLFAVFDGHGEFGHLVSRKCREEMPQRLISNRLDMGAAFDEAQDHFKSCEVDCSCSGATAVVIIIDNATRGRGGSSTLRIGNCGDSRAVVARVVNNTITGVTLTKDHKPDRPDERRRITAMGGKVGTRQVVVGHGPNGAITMPVGPARIWYNCRGETMGLAMSRSLGDLIAHRVGGSHEPEMTMRNLQEEDMFLLLATDGVWDVLDANAAVDIAFEVMMEAREEAGLGPKRVPMGGAAAGFSSEEWRSIPWDPEVAAKRICTTARRRWENLSAMVDDITCVVVKL
mmetsp:Transcript_38532/g.120617  ORF Transcript_38532/g.120617 Transcript_38532/m.120617 type:complete len:519 (+) Transcript_38532:355-1911(+)